LQVLGGKLESLPKNVYACLKIYPFNESLKSYWLPHHIHIDTTNESADVLRIFAYGLANRISVCPEK
jgi:hypothetical protein